MFMSLKGIIRDLRTQPLSIVDADRLVSSSHSLASWLQPRSCKKSRSIDSAGRILCYRRSRSRSTLRSSSRSRPRSSFMPRFSSGSKIWPTS